MSPDDILAELPDPREDEPAALRNDIAEELADHLICGVRREMVKGHDESTAWKRTLERFGDPRQIARKLWWQAMRSKIMGQRIILGFQAAIFVGMIVMAGVLVSLASSQQRQLAEQQNLVMAALVKVSDRFAEPAGPVLASHGSLKVQLKFAFPKAGRQEMESACDHVALQGLHVSNSDIRADRPVDPDSGLVDFGSIPTGAYEVTVTSRCTFKARRRIEIRAGVDVLETFAEPSLRLQTESQQLQFEASDEYLKFLKNRRLAVLFRLEPVTLVEAGQNWSGSYPEHLIWTSDRLWRWPTENFHTGDLASNQIARKNFLARIKDETRRESQESESQSSVIRRQFGVSFQITKIALISNPMSYSEWPVVAAINPGDADWPAELSREYEMNGQGPWLIPLPLILMTTAKEQLLKMSGAWDLNSVPEAAGNSSDSDSQVPADESVNLEFIWNTLGVRLAPLSADERSLIGPRYHDGLRVTETRPNIPSDDETAPVRLNTGDILVGLEQWETTSIGDCAWILRQPLPAGKRMRFFVIRDSETVYGFTPFANDAAPE